MYFLHLKVKNSLKIVCLWLSLGYICWMTQKSFCLSKRLTSNRFKILPKIIKKYPNYMAGLKQICSHNKTYKKNNNSWNKWLPSNHSIEVYLGFEIPLSIWIKTFLTLLISGYFRYWPFSLNKKTYKTISNHHHFKALRVYNYSSICYLKEL